MFGWIRRLKARSANWRRRATPYPMTERERAILARELRESARNAMGSPLDTTSSGDGILGKAANIAMNPAIRGGSTGNIGIPSQSLDETKGK
jgi:hypothetical protein